MPQCPWPEQLPGHVWPSGCVDSVPRGPLDAIVIRFIADVDIPSEVEPEGSVSSGVDGGVVGIKIGLVDTDSKLVSRLDSGSKVGERVDTIEVKEGLSADVCSNIVVDSKLTSRLVPGSDVGACVVCTIVKEVLSAVGSLETLLDISVSLELDGSEVTEVGVSVAAGPTNVVSDSVDDSRVMGSVDVFDSKEVVSVDVSDSRTVYPVDVFDSDSVDVFDSDSVDVSDLKRVDSVDVSASKLELRDVGRRWVTTVIC